MNGFDRVPVRVHQLGVRGACTGAGGPPSRTAVAPARSSTWKARAIGTSVELWVMIEQERNIPG